MSEKKKVTLYVTAIKQSYQKEFTIEVNSYDRASICQGVTTAVCIPLSVVEIEIEIPAIDGKQLQAEEVKQLQASIQKEKADSYIRVTAIEEKIQSLLCIENQSDKVGG